MCFLSETTERIAIAGELYLSCRFRLINGGQRMDPYYRSQKWNRKRDLALALAQHQCEFVHEVYGRCKCRTKLNVHHLTYERFKNELPSDLMVVCRHHHVWIHKQEKMTS